MYALWMQKEIETEYGYCKLEIYRKGIFDYVREIKALSADSLTISLENLGTITDPIGKSVCSFSIIDTDQVNYEDFFTPDATAYRVVVSTRVGGGAYVARWSGFITPDFFAENLSYRTPISLTARDNIGYLADVDFDLPNSTITVRELILSAFAKIAEPYPMSLSFATQKQTAEGVLAIDATISTALLRDMTWYEALETVLHDLGLQMRWVDNNTIAVIDVSQIPEYYATQGFNFIDASGYREILPAWRQLSQSQEYGLRENFFEGWLKSNNIRYVKSEVIRPPNATNWTTDIAWYVPNNWGVARDMFTIDPEFYGSKFNNKIFFTGASEEYPTTTYMSWRQSVVKSDKPMQIAFKAFNSILYPSQKYSNINTPSGRNLVAYNPLDEFLHSGKAGEFLQLGLKMNVFLHVGVDTYVLQGSWQQVSDSNKDWQLDFVLPKVELTSFDGPAIGVGPTEEEVTINMATVPYSGEIELRIYGYYIVGKHNYWEDEWTLNDYKFDWLKCVSYINNPVYTYNIENAETGQTSKTEIGPTHNVKDSQDYVFGQVPDNYGGINAFAGGLYRNDGTELNGFQRNAEGENYNLLELVGREVIHFNKMNYNKLSGTIKNLDKEPLMFNRLFVREGKTYAPFAYSLNVISNEMNITTMQEVEPYETATFTQIESEVSTGGATVGGGNNTVLQYSEKAGNAKRIYELNAATADEKNDGYLILDNSSFGEAKKVHISEVKDAELRDDFNALEKEVEAITSMLGDDTEGVIDTWTEVVNFLNGYKESDNLASILSGMQSDFLTLQDNVGVIATNLSNLSVKVNDIDERVIALEELGLSLVTKDGKTYVRSKYSLYSDGGLTSGGIGSGGGGGTGGGSNVTYRGEYTSGILLGKVTIDGVAGNIYAPSALSAYSNDVGYIKPNAAGNVLIGTTEDNGHLLQVGGSIYIPKKNNTYSHAIKLGHFASWNGQNYPTLMSEASDKFIMFYNPHIVRCTDGYTMSAAYIRFESISSAYWDIVVGKDAEDKFKICRNEVTLLDMNASGVTSLEGALTINHNNTYPLTINGSDTYSVIHIKSRDTHKADIGWLSDSRGDFAYIANVGNSGAITVNGSGVYYAKGNAIATNFMQYPIVHSGNIGSYNAGSATKLQTARTIWGQSFDGTGNVSGVLSDVNQISFDANISYGIFRGDWYNSALVREDLAFYAPKSVFSGNVLIGTTTDGIGKLQVSHDGTYPLMLNGSDKYSVIRFESRGVGVADIGWFNEARGNLAYVANISSAGVISVDNSGVYYTDDTSIFKKYRISILNTDNSLSVKPTGVNRYYNIGTLDATWGGSKGFGLIWSSSNTSNTGDIYTMIAMPHIPYFEKNKRGYTGETYGAIIRFESDTANTTVWDIGTKNDSFSIIRSNTNLFSIFSNENGAFGGTVAIPTSAWTGTLVVGKDGKDKAVIGYCASSTKGVVFGGHNSILNAWAPVNISGSVVYLRYNEEIKGTIHSTGFDVAGNIYATGGMTSGKASDRRLKQNIMNLQRTNAVNVLRSLRPVTFEWNATAFSLDQRNNGADVGFIADEYEGLIPNSGRAIWEKYRAIEYDKCIPHLVLGWQIHEGRFETVEERLAKAEGRIKELEAELKQYKTAA